MENELVKLDAKEYGLQENKAKEIELAFMPMLNKMKELEIEYNKIIDEQITQETSTRAKDLRLKYVKVRTRTASIHKEAKSFYLAGSRFVDAWKNTQLYASQGLEKKLEEIEKHFEEIEKQKKHELEINRRNQLSKYQDLDIALRLSDMSCNTWNIFLAGAELNYKNKIEAEKQAELLRQEKLREIEEEKKKKLSEQAQIRLENEKLKNEAEEKEKELQAERKIQQEKLDRERKKIESIQSKIKAKQKAEKEELEKKELEEKKLKAEPDKQQLKRYIETCKKIVTNEKPNIKDELILNIGNELINDLTLSFNKALKNLEVI